MAEASGQPADYTDGYKVQAQCGSCRQTTPWIYREKKSMFGLKTIREWTCTRCGTTQSDKPAEE
jgi:hypothetical protein